MSTQGAAAVTRRLTQIEADLICARHERLWASKPGGARAVFSWMDLSGLDFSGRNLADADFTGTVLAGAKLVKTRLDHANLFGADLQDADLTGASMKRADLRGACLRGANLTHADLFEADLREGLIAAMDKVKGFKLLEPTKRASEAQGAILAGANLERSRMSGVVALRADFTDAVLKDAKLVRANLKQANLHGADLSGADLSGADLRDAVLVGARTNACQFGDADMSGVLTDKPIGTDVEQLPYGQMLKDHALWCETEGAEGAPSAFNGADLRRLGSIKGFNLTALSARNAIFYGLDMEGVQLQGARLEGADLRGCNLRRADLRGARLIGAKLAGSDLRDAQLGPLLISSDRVLPCDLTDAVLKGADLSRADLRHAILVRADLSRANFSGAHMRHADITEAHLLSARGLETLF